MSLTSGRKTSGWALAVMSIQTFTASGRDEARERRLARDPLDVALEPEREHEQPPELARAVGAPRDVVVDHPLDRLRVEVALPAQRGRGERLAGEGLELAAQPGRGGD